MPIPNHSAGIRFSAEACETLARILGSMGTFCVRLSLADGGSRNVALLPPSNNWVKGTAAVRDWDEERGEPAGDPYIIDLYGVKGDAIHVNEILVY